MIKKRGLYIHIPFCVKKCSYCAFLSFAAEPETRRKYTVALIKEISTRAYQIIEDASKSQHESEMSKPEIDTVYLGGGTPSVLEVNQIKDIMTAIENSFEIKPDAEITIEVNPGTLGSDESEVFAKLSAYKGMGFNRLSMGVQSTDNERLKFLGRVHSAEDVERDVCLARSAGFDNINLDLIFSLPGETTEDALEDARRITELAPEHISCYSLQIEEGTPLAKMIESGQLTEVSDEEDRKTYHAICRLLKDKGYEHYEISNFAKPGYRSRHNSLYWDMSDYIGCGLGASGFVNGVRYKNTSDIDEYISANGTEAFHSQRKENMALDECHTNTPFDNISEAVFTGLRRIEGITYEEACHAYVMAEELPQDAEQFFWEIFADAKEEAKEFARGGFLITDEKGLRLTEQGIDISNQIMALFV